MRQGSGLGTPVRSHSKWWWWHALFAEEALVSVWPGIQGCCLSLVVILGFASGFLTPHLTHTPNGIKGKTTKNMFMAGLKNTQVQTHTKVDVMGLPYPSRLSYDFVPLLQMGREGINKADFILLVFPWNTIESDSKG